MFRFNIETIRYRSLIIEELVLSLTSLPVGFPLEQTHCCQILFIWPKNPPISKSFCPFSSAHQFDRPLATNLIKSQIFFQHSSYLAKILAIWHLSARSAGLLYFAWSVARVSPGTPQINFSCKRQHVCTVHTAVAKQ